jgi:glycosyltransferase involved in cell wall biosynthesis
MRVMHIITGLANGGAEAALYRLVTAASSGIEHRVVSLMDRGKYGPLLESAGVRVDSLGMERSRLGAGALLRLYRLMRSARPDVVQTWMYHANLIGGIVARLAGCRHVVWGIHHCDLDRASSKASTRAVARLGAIVSRRLPREIVCCAAQAARVHRRIGYADKLLVIPNGYDTTRFAPDPSARARLRAGWGVGPDEALLGMVARWHPQKDHYNLLDALVRVRAGRPNVKCVLVGDGCEAGNRMLVGWVRSLGLSGHVHLSGPRDDIPAVMNAIDLHVLSSSGEAFPNVLAEAMSCGTPCVATAVGDTAAIIGPTGWLVQPGRPDDLARAIVSALQSMQDREGWAARRAACRARIEERFSIGRMSESYAAVWRGSASGDGPDSARGGDDPALSRRLR